MVPVEVFPFKQQMDLLINFNTIPLNRTQSEYEEIKRIERVKALIFPIVVTFLMGFGIPGNMITIIVMSQRTMKDNLFSIYLTSLCFFNILTLVWCVPRFLVDVHYGRDILIQNDRFCAFYRIVSYSLLATVNWHLVAISAARLFFIFDTSKKLLKFYGKPLFVILIITATVTSIETPAVLNWIKYVDEKGRSVECYAPHTSELVHFQVFFQIVLPALVLTTMNIYLVYMNRKERSGLMENPSTLQVRRQLLLLVFVSSIQYLITLTPMCFFFPIAKAVIDLKTPLGQTKAKFGFGICLLIMYGNSGTNFLVYCFFGKKFRNELFKVLKTWRQNFRLGFHDVTLQSSDSRTSRANYRSEGDETSLGILTDYRLPMGKASNIQVAKVITMGSAPSSVVGRPRGSVQSGFIYNTLRRISAGASSVFYWNQIEPVKQGSSVDRQAQTPKLKHSGSTSTEIGSFVH